MMNVMLRMLFMMSVVFGLVSTANAEFDIWLSFQNDKGRMMGQPPVMTFGGGYMFVEAKWQTSYTEKDDVYYNVWVRSETSDWGSANAPNASDEGGGTGWRQHAYLGRLKQGARAGAKLKLSFDYRPAGLSSFTMSDGGRDEKVVKLGEAMPLAPGTYPFTVCVQRIGPAGVSEIATKSFDVTIRGDATAGSVWGIADYQVFQRASKERGDVSFRLVGLPSGTSWNAEVSKAGEAKALEESSGSATSRADLVKLAKIPVGGPYDVQINAGSLSRKFTNVFIGDLWIVSGQSNAVGVGYDLEQGAKPIPGVHSLNPKYGTWEWGMARDGLFEQTVGPWVTAAQVFYAKTGVPVGLMGHAVGSRTMDFFLGSKETAPYFLRPLVERHGVGAAAFFWYQGESDAFNEDFQRTYLPKLEQLAAATRACARNPRLLIGICQLGRYTWHRDDHFAAIREAQRQFVLSDRRSVLYSTLIINSIRNITFIIQVLGCPEVKRAAT